MKALIFTLTISLFTLPSLAGEGKVCNEEFLNKIWSSIEEMRELITLENIKNNLAEGHDVNCVQEEGFGLLHIVSTPYTYPLWHSYSEEELLESRKKNKLILEEKKKIITYLVEEKGADIELYLERKKGLRMTPITFRMTPITSLVRWSLNRAEYEIFFLLIALGADINHEYKKGKTVLDRLRETAHRAVFPIPDEAIVPLSSR